MLMRQVIGRTRTFCGPVTTTNDGTTILVPLVHPPKDDQRWGPWREITHVVSVQREPRESARWQGTPGRPKLAKLRR